MRRVLRTLCVGVIGVKLTSDTLHAHDRLPENEDAASLPAEMRYAIVRGFARLLLAIFYRRLEIYGLERVPRRGPLVVAANHHNALVDPMLLIATMPRRLSPLAKAPLFAHPLIAPFLWLSHAIPVYRRGESAGDVARNEAMFSAASAGLRAGGAILIFPEGVSQPEPMLLPLRTGIARLTLDALAATPGLGVTVLPVGLIYHRPADFRTGRGIVVVGEPVEFGDLVDREAGATAVHQLTDRVAAALRALIVEARDRQTLRVLEVAHDVWQGDTGEAPAPERLAWMREAVRRWNTLAPDLRDRADRLRHELERYDKDAAELRGASHSSSSRGYALRDGLLMALGLPLAILGVVIHGIGYRATAMTVRAARPEPDTSATYQLAAGLVLFPLSWALEAAALDWASGRSAVWLFAALLIPTGFFALTWRDRLQRFPREARSWAGLVTRGRLDERLVARRQWLRDELTALARLTSASDGGAEPAR